MKKYINSGIRFSKAVTPAIAILLSFLVTLVSCRKFLEEKPITAYSTDQFFDSPAKLNMAVAGIYDVLANRELFGTNLLMLAADTDIEFARGTTVSGSNSSIEEVCHYNGQSTSGPLEAVWRLFYVAINRANNAISNAEKVPVADAREEQLVSQYVAEAKALRAFIYANLVRMWGDVPLRLEPSDLSQNLLIGRTAKADVYKQISEDFEEAIPNLPWHDDAVAVTGRLNKGAAMALYARACLFAGGYSLYQDGSIKREANYLEYYKKAEQLTADLINSGKHALNPNYEAIFKNICGNIAEPKESMFEIDFAYLYGQDRHASTVGTVTTGVAVKNHSAQYNVGPKMFTHYYFYQTYDTADLRRDASIANYYLNGINFQKVAIPVTSSATWTCAKWRRDWQTTVPTNWSLSDVNYVVMRYAEVLLMRAEVLNELNNAPTAEAVSLVKQVRQRGYRSGANYELPPAAIEGKDAFLNFLSYEYAREFYGEGNRKYDLVRWNLLGKRIAETGVILNNPANIKMHGLKVYLAANLFKTGKHELYPIPEREIVESSGVLKQNPGFN